MNKQLEFLIYQSADEDVSVNAMIHEDTIWLTQRAMGELFGVDKSTISRHLRNIFNEGELDENVVVAFFATTTKRNWCIFCNSSDACQYPCTAFHRIKSA